MPRFGVTRSPAAADLAGVSAAASAAAAAAASVAADVLATSGRPVAVGLTQVTGTGSAQEYELKRPDTSSFIGVTSHKYRVSGSVLVKGGTGDVNSGEVLVNINIRDAIVMFDGSVFQHVSPGDVSVENVLGADLIGGAMTNYYASASHLPGLAGLTENRLKITHTPANTKLVAIEADMMIADIGA